MTDIPALADLAERAARAGGAVAERRFRRDVAVETKGHETDVVTRADREAQRQVAATVHDERPDDVIVGEEDDEPSAVPDEGTAWIVDPIDGTGNFVRDVPVWATSVAAVRDGEAIAAATVCPALDDVYLADAGETTFEGSRVAVSDRDDPETFEVAPLSWWGFDRREEYAAVLRELVTRFADVRRIGSTQIALSMVAAGQLDAALTTVDPYPWDAVAGALMVERAGGVVTDLEGEPWTHASRGLVASNGHAHDELLAAARAAVG